MNLCIIAKDQKDKVEFICNCDLNNPDDTGVDQCEFNKLGYKKQNYCVSRCEGCYCSNQQARQQAKTVAFHHDDEYWEEAKEYGIKNRFFASGLVEEWRRYMSTVNDDDCLEFREWLSNPQL